jgi:hypothetical protein
MWVCAVVVIGQPYSRSVWGLPGRVRLFLASSVLTTIHGSLQYDAHPPGQTGASKGGKGSKKVDQSRDEPIVLRSNSQRQAEAAAAAGQASPREDAPASGSAAADQQRQQQQQSR